MVVIPQLLSLVASNLFKQLIKDIQSCIYITYHQFLILRFSIGKIQYYSYPFYNITVIHSYPYKNIILLLPIFYQIIIKMQKNQPQYQYQLHKFNRNIPTIICQSIVLSSSQIHLNNKIPVLEKAKSTAQTPKNNYLEEIYTSNRKITPKKKRNHRIFEGKFQKKKQQRQRKPIFKNSSNIKKEKCKTWPQSLKIWHYGRISYGEPIESKSKQVQQSRNIQQQNSNKNFGSQNCSSIINRLQSRYYDKVDQVPPELPPINTNSIYRNNDNSLIKTHNTLKYQTLDEHLFTTDNFQDKSIFKFNSPRLSIKSNVPYSFDHLVNQQKNTPPIVLDKKNYDKPAKQTVTQPKIIQKISQNGNYEQIKASIFVLAMSLSVLLILIITLIQ